MNRLPSGCWAVINDPGQERGVGSRGPSQQNGDVQR